MIRYLIRLKSGISCVASHNYAKIKTDSDNNLPLEKALTMHNVAMLIESVFIKNNIMQSYKNV